MNFSDLPILMTFPEHLSSGHAYFQFIVGIILTITSATCFLYTNRKSAMSGLLAVFGITLVKLSFNPQYIMHKDLLIVISGMIGLQIYLMARTLYKRTLIQYGIKYRKPDCIAWLFPQVFPYCSVAISAIFFTFIYTTLIQ